VRAPVTITPSTKKNSALLDLVKYVQVGGQSVGAMLLFDVAKDFDVFAAELLPKAQQLPRAPLDEARPANVRENKAFDANEIKVGFGSNFPAPFRGRFQHLESNRSVEILPNGCRDPLQSTRTASGAIGGLMYGKSWLFSRTMTSTPASL